MKWMTGAMIAVTIALVCGVAGVGAQLPGTEGLPAPHTVLSADGTSATDGVRTLSVSQAHDLDPSGQTITVSGMGYEEFKGVYIAFCVIPPTNHVPSPCGGGIDMDGATGASQWISSNPPDYGEGLAIPYGPGGSFSVNVQVAPAIGSTVDCRRVSCAVVTRNDHVRSTDRSQDIFIPVTFASATAPSVPQEAPDPGAQAPPPPPPPVEEEPIAPEEEVTTTLPPTTTTSTVAEGEELASEPPGGSGSPWGWVAGGLAGAVVLAIGAGALVRWRRRASAEP